MKKILTSLTVLACLSAAPAMTQAAEPLKLVVGFPAGGGADALARIVANELSTALNQSVVVDNKPGAGGTIASGYIARSSPTSNELLFGDTSMLIAPNMYKQVTYKWDKDFTPVAMAAAADFVIAVPPDSPIKNFADYIKMAKEKPGFYTYGSSGVGSIHHLAGEMLQTLADIKVTHVPYRGGNQSMQAVASGDVTMAIASLGAALPYLQGKKVRVIAMLADFKYTGLENIPAASETLPEYKDIAPSLFILAPKGFDSAKVQAISDALKKAVQTDKVKNAMTLQGSRAMFKDSKELAEWMPVEAKKWTDVINNAHITFEK